MNAVIKLVITEDKRVLEVFENRPGKLSLFIGDDEPEGNGYDIEVDTEEFLRLLKRVIIQKDEGFSMEKLFGLSDKPQHARKGLKLDSDK